MPFELKNFDSETKKINSWNLTYRQKVNIVYPENLRELKNVIKYFKKTDETFAIKTGECSYDSKSISLNKNSAIISLKKFNKILQVDKRGKFILCSFENSLCFLFES